MTSLKTMDNSFFYRYRNILFCLFLIAATLSVYSQIYYHDFVNYDDNVYVTENRHIQTGFNLESISWALTSSHASNWHPITWLSHMLDYQLFNMNPGLHHLVNLFLHIINSLLLFVVLKKMTGRFWPSGFVAALFALHPLHVESVAWISERKDVLSTLFWMLTLWGYTWYVEHPQKKRYVVVLVLFSMGLMTKPMLVTLPFVLLLLDYWPLNRISHEQKDTNHNTQQWSIIRRLVLEKAPFFLLAVISSTITFIVQKQGGAVSSLEAISLGTRITNALVSYVMYLYKMILPFNMGVFYPYPNTILLWKTIGAGIFLVFISFFVIRSIKARPYLFVGWFWYLWTLIPVIGIVQIGSQAMADRYTYIPIIGIFIILTWSLSEVIMHQNLSKIILPAIAGPILIVFMTITYFQVQHWKNSVTLWEHALDVTTNNYIPHNNLGEALQKQGRDEEAIRHFQAALQIKPDYEKAHNNLGNILYEQQNIDEAIEHFLEALRIKPDYEKAHNNLGLSFQHQGQIDKAIKHYKVALQIDPEFANAHNNLGNALQTKGRLDEAIKHYKKALTLKPNSPEFLYNLGNAFAGLGRIPEAIHQYKEALRLKPDFADAYNSLGYAFQRMGRMNEAIQHYEDALRINPHSPDVHFNLASALDNQGQINGAIEHYKEALKINPDSMKVHYNLGNALQRVKRLDEAIEHYQAVLRINPDYVDAYNNLGAVLYYKGDINGAIGYFQKALQIDPDNIQIKNNLDQLLIIQKQR